ncbi:Pre-mRNA splicing factor PRP21 like protein-domain-containing protein [Fimicolochytrium jonesii]|uniref:Pre-mRNA splicing factor PRP21 like protein-domain-containing protein n=1 Tax=Fimicolochytrium jonesii TaxID=1396493 RepID=UPI0022FE3FE1|nr:Pre-mRNA splicing factor PRP21 like protein-domain-containing protein [Fimicolochytrium jonesii]KAI8824193.1 Pre-mRNA splicing factor PRP21 like protein-domain-containing protein [Fimicolochytrium jonesii]
MAATVAGTGMEGVAGNGGAPGGPALIYPPPEIKNIVDKTAVFVARMGPSFEERMRERERFNPKFCFLNPTDPYRAYYDFKIAEAREGTGAPEQGPEDGKVEPAAEAVPEPVVKPPEPASYEFMADVPSMSAQDLDVVKLTAQLVARNGRDFMIALMKREMRNYQFDFLRTNHSLFPFFTKLVEQYTKVLMPPAALNERLRENVENKFALLERINERVTFRLYQEEERKKAEEEADEERVAYASIDWHDFVIVDTVEFVEADERMALAPPLNLADLERMSLTQKKAALAFEFEDLPQVTEDADGAEMEVEMDEDMDMDED